MDDYLLTLDDIQSQADVWLFHNYQSCGPAQYNDTLASLASIVEESGELIEAVTDKNDMRALRESQDAIGDIMIGCICYAVNEQWNFSEIFAERGSKKIESSPENLLVILSKLSRATLKGKVQYPMRREEYEIKAVKAMKQLFRWLEFSIPARDIVAFTWESWKEVRTRVYGPNHGTIEPYKWSV